MMNLLQTGDVQSGQVRSGQVIPEAVVQQLGHVMSYHFIWCSILSLNEETEVT